jgi:hypothetical protein
MKMHTNARFLFLLILLVSGITHTPAQTIWENTKAEVYPYLERMADKGLIQLNDLVKPLGRNTIYRHLTELQSKEAQLSAIEKKELHFYLEEYSNAMAAPDSVYNDQVKAFKKDGYHRWRSFTAEGGSVTLQIDPLLGMGFINGTDQSVKQYNSGVDAWGTVGKHWGYQFYFRDFNETGTGMDRVTQNTPNTGIIIKDTSNYSSLNYSETRAAITYTWNKGVISFGQDHLLWGYGQNGLITVSDKSPVFPYIRFDYQLFKWLHFNYDHIWLSSDIVDSARTYPNGNIIYGGQRVFYQPKYMAMHSANFRLKKGLTAALGESMIYSDNLLWPYLIPVLFYKIYDYETSNSYNNAGSNAQIFLNIDSRNQVAKTHLYGTLFIDELSVSNIFNEKKKRNQIGYTIGAEKRDVLLPYLTVGVEYTRVNPFVYRNFIPAQDYSNHNYSLGDWMGNNFDRWILFAKYHPAAKLSLIARYQYSRKGGAGTLTDQYYAQPQPPFLFDLQNKTTELYFQCRYEWIHRLYLNLTAWQQHIQLIPTHTEQNTHTLQVSISYGL